MPPSRTATVRISIGAEPHLASRGNSESPRTQPTASTASTTPGSRAVRSDAITSWLSDNSRTRSQGDCHRARSTHERGSLGTHPGSRRGELCHPTTFSSTTSTRSRIALCDALSGLSTRTLMAMIPLVFDNPRWKCLVATGRRRTAKCTASA